MWRLFKQHEWCKEVDAEIQQNRENLKVFARFKNNLFPRKTLFWDKTHQGNVSGYWGLNSLLKIVYHISLVVKTNSTPSKISFLNLADTSYYKLRLSKCLGDTCHKLSADIVR